ncbi:hypothetical protein GCM10010988_28900 [Cnuibacter physcomitrellae]|nr:hypothetical protein GCM10010988_28900 [Cnuibacter physcomitrellae]
MTRLGPGQRADLRSLHGRITDADHERLTRLAVLIATRTDDPHAVRELTREFDLARDVALRRVLTESTPARVSPER